MHKILVIVGSVRPERRGRKIADWFMGEAENYEGNLELELVDLKDWDLPLLDEPKSPAARDYQHQHTKDWTAKIDSADGYIMVTPEYNHGYPASVKNALDFAYHEWKRKPMAIVSYGGYGAGLRATEQLRPVINDLQMMPIRPTVSIRSVGSVFEDPEFLSKKYAKPAQSMLEDLEWWAIALATTRQQSE